MFKGTTKPDLPDGFVDRSYGNDVCSHFEKEWKEYTIDVWINYDDIKLREYPHQYMVSIRKKEESEIEDGVEFSLNDFSAEGLRIASVRIKKEVWKLMKKYA